MNKKIISAIGATLLLISTLTPVLANHKSDTNDSSSSNVPEKNGVYNDPDHKGLKVRVFVHNEKPARTITSTSAPLCGLDDPNSSAVVGWAGWKLPTSWTYNLNQGSVPSSVGGSSLIAIASNGFTDWSNATGGKVNFVQGAPTSVSRSSYDGKNIIAWGRINASALGITYIRYYTSTGQVVDVDTIMNKRYPWSWSNSATCADPNTYNAEDILTHEQGHWIGMDDEYDASFQDNTMFGYGSLGEVKKVTLTTGDVNGAHAIYP